jgi:hypothetical protein
MVYRHQDDDQPTERIKGREAQDALGALHSGCPGSHLVTSHIHPRPSIADRLQARRQETLKKS